MTLESHPLRDVIVSEMHMRRMPPLAAPVTMTQTVRLLAPEERDTERAHIGAMPHVAGEALGIRDRDAAGRADGVELLWELGRASCRESVYQYVLISVVAVALQKKVTALTTNADSINSTAHIKPCVSSRSTNNKNNHQNTQT